jgi:hypothetical protein
MATFLPQHAPNLIETNSDRSSISPNSSSPSPNGTKKTDFRMNPLTGGYYLSPNQYQEMMQTYMQNLLIAAQSSNNISNVSHLDTTLNESNPFLLSPTQSASFNQAHRSDFVEGLFLKKYTG